MNWPTILQRRTQVIPSPNLQITFLELFLRKKAQNKAEWLVPPSHHWYKGRKPGLSLSLPCIRQFSTRLASGHLNCLTYSEGNKIYPKYQQHQASPKHILDCLGLDWEEIFSSPLLVIDFIKVNGFLDLVGLDRRLVTTTKNHSRKFVFCFSLEYCSSLISVTKGRKISFYKEEVLS
ncbi:hypothetical protein AVEN_97311-1 [Araneus ventricosus]|uniref:Uncharacterized protein n=1 Tax=Araneus ventricosus TaxID=182803 RepID=A0A4Y2HQ05_ARAVE|nr:hypothetical protein AVEN_97311-1 [Araneus ventricosus]